MDPPWIEVGPDALCRVPTLAHRIDHIDAVSIIENGASAEDYLTSEGHVWDTGRTMCPRNYISHLHRAIETGAPVEGYFLWNLLDNIEWVDGYKNRFGINYVDFETQKRTPKLSSYFYKAVIAANTVTKTSQTVQTQSQRSPSASRHSRAPGDDPAAISERGLASFFAQLDYARFDRAPWSRSRATK